ncbi:MAG: DUF935 domain-containing protein [Paracoccaceae bacterium]
MARPYALVDPYGRPVVRSTLKEEIAAPTTSGVRSPITSYPGDGLDPVRLGSILREADRGDPMQYMELAETIEERDAHYLGVLGTRRRSVSQLDINVEPASGDPIDKEKAERVEKWLKRLELSDELFDILDAIGKGYSFTEIIWDSSSGQWEPKRLEARDQRWFRFETYDLRTPLMLTESGQKEPLPGFKFIFGQIKAKTGLPLRSGLARVAMWCYLFKKYTERDWAIFTQGYGQPVRLGKYGPGASKEDRQKLLRAVSNIAGDFAAIIPESMQIEFVEAGNVGTTNDLYKSRADWLDQQVSKAVVGQTATTDAVTGGLGSGKEHRQVQEDIEQADANSLSAIINRDLIRPWMDLEYGPGGNAPTVLIGTPEPEDIAALSTAVTALVGVGFRVSQKEMRTRLGLSEPEAGEEILIPPGQNVPELRTETETARRGSIFERFLAAAKYQSGQNGPETHDQSQRRSTGRTAPPSPVGLSADRLVEEAQSEIEGMVGSIAEMLDRANSYEEFAEMVGNGFHDLDDRRFRTLLQEALMAAEAAGWAAIEEEAGG